MRRREVIGLLGALAAAAEPRLALAQGRPLRIGLLAPGSSAGAAEFVEEPKAGLREQGFFDGENVRIEPGFGETHKALDDIAIGLVRSNVNLIVAWEHPRGFGGKTRDWDSSNRHGRDRGPDRSEAR